MRNSSTPRDGFRGEKSLLCCGIKMEDLVIFVSALEGIHIGITSLSLWSVCQSIPFADTTYRRLSKQSCKNMENLYKVKVFTEKNWKKFRQKVKLLVLSQFSFCHNVFKSCLLYMRLNASTSEKVLSFSH